MMEMMSGMKTEIKSEINIINVKLDKQDEEMKSENNKLNTSLDELKSKNNILDKDLI